MRCEHTTVMLFSSNNLTLLLNTLTNCFAFPVIVTCYKKNFHVGVCIISLTFLASCLMHITETKHHLRPFIWHSHSQTFLNLDRLFSFATFLYGLTFIRKISLYNLIFPSIEIVIGFCCLRLGEITLNLWYYNLLHTVWHFTAFDVLYRLIILTVM